MIRNSLILLFCLLRITAFSQEDTVYNAEQIRIFSLMDKLKTENKLIEFLDPEALTSLPIGIVREYGSTRYIIAIDSAVFKPNGAYFNAYMAIEFPNSDKKIAFAAKNIKFNPSGVIGSEQSKLVLVSKHSFNISPHVKLNLLPDGSNYVEWNCEGFQSVNLRGEFEFSGDRMIPVTANNLPDISQRVKATFEIHTNDIHNFITSVNITPFTLRGLKDWSFQVTNAVVDMSEISNFPSMVFPAGYVMDFPSTPNYWTGFYLKELKVKLPSELGKPNQPTVFTAQNVLIDGAGFSGRILGQNIFSIDDGSMSGWGFSLNELSVDFISNQLSAGSMKGEIRVPAMKNNGLRYQAMLTYQPGTKETNYSFTVSPQADLSFDAFMAKVDLYNTSQIIIQKTNGEFIPKAILNGRISLEHGNASTAKLDFQNLTFVTYAPYLIQGTFASVDPETPTQNMTAGFDVSISNFKLVVSRTAPKLTFDAMINFMEVGDHSFSGVTTVSFTAKINEGTDSQIWDFDNMKIEKIGLNVTTQVFRMRGEIEFYENDPIFGKGFDGKIVFGMQDWVDQELEVNVVFGKSGYRYFYADAYVPFNLTMGAINITRLIGGLYYHMRPLNSVPSQFYSSINSATVNHDSRTKYIPDNSISIGFKAGVSYRSAKSEKALNGDAMLEMAFSSAGGLDFIRLDGKAFMLATVQERITRPAPAYGSVLIQYDNVNKIFDATLSFNVNANGVTGQANSKIHIEPEIWFVCLGKPTLPASLSLQGFGTASTYVMVGNQLEPMAPPPYQVASLVNATGLNNLRNAEALANASGFVGGIRIASAFSNERDGNDDRTERIKIYAYFAYGAGLDMMLANYGSNAHCSGSAEIVGLNGWVASGQLYCHLEGAVGVKGKVFGEEFDIKVLSGSIAAILAGKLPKPSYLYGALACQYCILGIINGSFTFDFTLGNNCTIVN